MWWITPESAALGRLRQENYFKFSVSLGYKSHPYHTLTKGRGQTDTERHIDRFAVIFWAFLNRKMAAFIHTA